MLNGNNDSLLSHYYKKGPEIGLYNNHLTIRSIKLYADGALGSRGAWLIEDYEDAEGEHGHIVTPVETLKKVTKEGFENGFQICTHAIGDMANREVLNIYNLLQAIFCRVMSFFNVFSMNFTNERQVFLVRLESVDSPK